MGREVKRVALDFDWPLNKTWEGFLLHRRKAERNIMKHPVYNVIELLEVNPEGWEQTGNDSFSHQDSWIGIYVGNGWHTISVSGSVRIRWDDMTLFQRRALWKAVQKCRSLHGSNIVLKALEG